MSASVTFASECVGAVRVEVLSVVSVTKGSTGDTIPNPSEMTADSLSRFVSDLRRPHDALRVLRFVLNHPDGYPLTKLVSETLGKTNTRRNERFVRRLIETNPKLFVTDRSQDVWHVAPAKDALHLITDKQISKPPEGEVSDRDTVRSLLKDQRQLNETGRQIVLDRFASYVDTVDSKRLVLQNKRAKGEQYAVFPYRTRFTDESRRNELWAKFHGAWENASDEYRNASLLTLTTDPKMHDSLKDAWENISDSFNRLMSWLSSDSRLGYRPDYIGVLEPTDKGFPHLHVVVFGESWLVDQRELSEYWSKYQGKIVDIRRLRNRNGKWVQPSKTKGALVTDGGESSDDRDDDGADLHAQAYLGKYLKKMTEQLDADPSELCNTDASETEAWKLGMYWATDRQIVRSSHDLKPDDDSDESQTEVVLKSWEFLGSWDARDIPARFLRNRRPSPQENEPPPEPLVEVDDES